MKIIPLESGNFKLDGGAMFGVVPKVIWSKVYPSDENNLCNWAMRCMLVDNGDSVVLIDAGMGEKQSDKFFGYYYLNGDDSLLGSLRKNGYSVDDITHVIVSHLHFDHCGGVISRNNREELVPTFPNAEIIVSKKQWLWATDPNRRERASFLEENILPMENSGKLKLIDDEVDILPHIRLLQFDGHSDGQIVPVITSDRGVVAFAADLLPSTAHIPMPYIMSYDTRPLITLKDKERFYKMAIDGNWVIFLEHDINNECCTLVEGKKGVEVGIKGKLQDILS